MPSQSPATMSRSRRVDVETLLVQPAARPCRLVRQLLAEMPRMRQDESLHLHGEAADGDVLLGQPLAELQVLQEGIPWHNRVPTDAQADPVPSIQEPAEH